MLDRIDDPEDELIFHEEDKQISWGELYNQINRALSVYTLDEILAMNNFGVDDALAYLFEMGYIGLPDDVYDDSEDSEP